MERREMSSGIVGMARYLTQPEEQEQRQLTFTSGLNRLAWNTAREEKKKFASRRNPFIFRPTQASRSALEVQASRTLNKVQFAESSASTPSPPTTSPAPTLTCSPFLSEAVKDRVYRQLWLASTACSIHVQRERMNDWKKTELDRSGFLYISSIHHTAEEPLYFLLSFFFIKYIV